MSSENIKLKLVREESGYVEIEVLMNPKELEPSGRVDDTAIAPSPVSVKEEVIVKEEPVCANEINIDVNRTAYVKKPMLVKQEDGATSCLKEKPIQALSVMENSIVVKEEAADAEECVSEAARNLYDEHEVQHVFLLGPEVLKQLKIRISDPAIPNTELKHAAPKREYQPTDTREVPEISIKKEIDGKREDSSTLELETSHITTKDNARFVCDVCNKGLMYKYRLVTHLRIHTGSKPFSCDICKKNFSDKNNLTSHKKTHTFEKPYRCKICNKEFKDKRKLTVHLRIHVVKGQKPFSCEICQKRFTTKRYLMDHMRIHTGEKPYSCKICNERFRNTSILNQHKKKHSVVKVKRVPKLYPCETCNKLFSKKSYATAHKLIHTGEKPYGCDICKKQFRKKLWLTYHHKRIHGEEKTYSCYVCKMSFSDRDDLNNHKVIHLESKPTCDICKKQFSTKQSLTNHLRVHTGEQPYSCKICNKKFKTKKNLPGHMRIHTGEKPYVCDICNKRFALKCGLNEHKRTHTGKPYACEVCKKQFKRKEHYTAHMRKCQPPSGNATFNLEVVSSNPYHWVVQI